MNAKLLPRLLLAIVSLAVIIAGLIPPLFAQNRGSRPVPGSLRPSAPRSNRFRPGQAVVPLRRYPMQGNGKFIPSDIPVRSVEGVKGFRPKTGTSRIRIGGEGGAVVQEQIVNITQTPAADEITPFWTSDEQQIYFSGNRELGRYQLYRLNANASNDPSAVAPPPPTRITNDNDLDYLFPSLNVNSSRIAFIRSGDTKALSDPTKRWDLFVANVPVSGFIERGPGGATNLISLTAGRTFAGRAFATIQRPAWLGSSDVVFSARLEGDANFHIFSVNVTSGLIFQLTDGPADERNPAVAPNNRFIAFDSNAKIDPDPQVDTAYTGGTQPRQDTIPGNPARATGLNPSGRRNIFVMGALGQQARQFSNRYPTAPDVDNIQPAWSTVQTQTPEINPTSENVFIAFASTRRDVRSASDPAQITNYTVGSTYDIYYAHAEETPGAGSGLTEVEGVPTDEAENPARKLETADPEYRFNDQYPTWAAFINIQRICHQSDRTGTLLKDNVGQGFRPTSTNDLFISTVIDITAPTLLRYDTSRADGEVVHINLGNTFVPGTGASVRNRSQGIVPGGDVFFTVRVEDREAGLRPDKSVYLMFKNPNSKYQAMNQGGEALEHKEYAGFSFLFPEGQTVYPFVQRNGANFGAEYEYQAISAADRATYFNHRFTNGAQGPIYVSSIDDALAFSGNFSPPLDGGTYILPDGSTITTPNIWLELKPLKDASGNPIRDQQGGILYGAPWRTPADPGDWYVDVILYDNAVNPYEQSLRSNWIIYDNVWGFSTSQLGPSSISDILVVADYTIGQKFFRSRFGEPNNPFTGAVDNLLPVLWGAETYFTDIDMNRYPTVGPPPPGSTDPRFYSQQAPFIITAGRAGFDARGGLLNGIPNTLGVNSYADEYSDDGTRVDGRVLPPVGRYNIWRVLARGPVPVSVLQDYLPQDQVTPPDTRVGETTPRTVRVANRMVVWTSPFSGDLFVGPGTIIDAETQTNLTNFVNAGGRLFISGQDIGFALTFNGGRTNAFFTNILKAQYVNDNGGDGFITATLDAPGSNGDNSIARDPWTRARHAYGRFDGTFFTYNPPSTDPIGINNAFTGQDARGDAANTSAYSLIVNGGARLDVITPTDGAYSQFNFRNGQTGIITSTFPSGGRVAYASYGFESTNYDWYLAGTPPTLFNLGRRAEIMHNITCSFRTGAIIGQIRNASQGGTPLTDVLVRAVPVVGAEDQAAVATAATDANGNFQIVGLKPDLYVIYAYRRGFTIQHNSGNVTHGGFRTQTNLLLTEAPPGALAGKVLRGDGVTPVQGIEVQLRAMNVDGSIFVLRAVSGADGSYNIAGVPIDRYIVVSNPKNVDEAGNPIPETDPRFNRNYNPNVSTVVVTDPSQPDIRVGQGTVIVNGRVEIRSGETSRIDFLLSGAPQPVSGRVFDTANTSAGIVGATVTATRTDANGNVVTVGTTTTGPNGAYSFPAVTEGVLTITATAPGFTAASISVTVAAGPITGADIGLTRQPPGSISGLVSLDGTAAAGATVRLLQDQADGTVKEIQVVTTTGAQTAPDGYVFNYRFDNVLADNYRVTAERNGLRTDPISPPGIPVTVTPAMETRNINFRILPLRIFASGLQMISTPRNYQDIDPRSVFSLPANTPASDFNIARWTGQDYVIDPNLRFRLGEGYFVKFPRPVSVSVGGNPGAAPGTSFEIPLPYAGWHQIGNPFDPNLSGDVELTSISVRAADGRVLPLAQATQEGLVRNVVFYYTGSDAGSQYVQDTRLQHWLGYWFRTFQPVTLVLNGVSRSAAPGSRKALSVAEMEASRYRSITSKGASDWRLQIAARQGSLSDSDNSVGVAPGAKNGFDFLHDNEKPPMITQVPSVYLSMQGTNESGRSAAFTDDIRAADGTPKTWDFTVEAGGTGEVTVFWPNVNRMPRNMTPVLVDVVTGKRIPMRSASSYRYAPSGRAARSFRIEVKPPASQPLALLNVKQTRSRSAGYRFTFTVTREADVDAEIQTLTGRVLRRLHTRSRAATETSLSWDGRATSGGALPAGPYVLSLTARDNEGNIVRDKRPMLILR